MTSVVVTIHAGSVEDVIGMVERRLTLEGLAGWMNSSLTMQLSKRAADRFHNQGDDASGPWAELADATKAIRSASGYNPSSPINERTGALFDYIVGGETSVRAEGVDVVGVYPEAPPSNAGLLSKLTHAQKGGTGSSGRAFPARPVLALSEVDLMETEISLMEYIFLGGRR